jgi:hypothetical protein
MMKRKQFLTSLATLPLFGALMKLSDAGFIYWPWSPDECPDG